MKEPTYVAATLRWCNARRKEKGLAPLKKLPKGHKSDPKSCPCGKATGLAVFGHDYCDDKDRNEVHIRPYFKPLPAMVQRFVSEFDEGKLPQYEN